MVKLVAIALPASSRFAEAIEQTWARGDAFCVLDPRLPKREAELTLRVLGADSILDETGSTTLTTIEPRLAPLQDGDALVIATSGSSGEPKAVVHTRVSVEASAVATSKALNVDPAADRWLSCLPLSHIGGLSVVLRALHTGAGLELHAGFDAEAVTLAARGGATLVSLVTKALRQIDASLFRSILVGGAAPPPNRPKNVIATYGMTETGSGVVYDETPIDGVEIQLAGDGEITLRGPMLFRSYRSTPTADSTSSSKKYSAGSWFYTGDIGHWSETGELVIDGRKDDVITTGGEKVWPGRTEAALRTLPTVGDAVVLPEADPDWGQRVVAVVTVVGDRPPTLDEVRAHIKQTLPSWYAPKKLLIRSDLPSSPLGKIKRRKINLDD